MAKLRTLFRRCWFWLKDWQDSDAPVTPFGLLGLLLVSSGFFFWITREPVANGPDIPFLPPTASLASSLTVWGWGTPVDRAVVERLIADFESKSGETIQLSWFESEETYRQARDSAWKNGHPPDLFLTNATEIESLHVANRIMPIPLRFEEVANWFPETVAPFQRDQTLLAIPSDFSLLVLYFNRKFFDQAGIAYPHEQWTWDVWVSLARAVYQPPTQGNDPAVLGLELPLRTDLWNAFAVAAGGSLYHDRDWLLGTTGNRDIQLQALGFYLDFYCKYAFCRTPAQEAAGTRFEQGKAAMIVAGSELLFRLPATKNLAWGITSLPHNVSRATPLLVNAWAIANGTRHAPAAAQLVHLLAAVSSRSDWLPACKTVAPGQNDLGAAIFYAQLPQGIPPGRVSAFPEITSVLNQTLFTTIKKSEPDPADILKQMTTQVAPLLDSSKN